MKNRLSTLLLAFILVVEMISSLSMSSLADDLLVFDAASPDDSVPTEIPAVDLFVNCDGIILLESEKNYLQDSGMRLIYSGLIPSNCVVVEQLDNGLKITANVFSYESNSGVVVQWNPVSARIRDTEKELSSILYEALFEDCDGTEKYEVSVRYQAEIIMPQSDYSNFVNKAYSVGVLANERLLAFEEAESEYNRKAQEYEELKDAYIIALNNYIAYLQNKEEYNDQKEAYDNYISKITAYEEQLAAYNAYPAAKEAYDIAYAQYLLDIEEYTESYNTYTAFIAQLTAYNRAMAAINYVFTKDSNNNSLYSAIMNGNSFIFANKTRLINEAGVDAQDIENAESAQNTLQTILPLYTELDSKSEQLDFYDEHYSDISDRFALYYSSMRSIIRNSVLRSILQKNDKYESMCRFIARLYVVSSCLDDTKTLDPSWTIREYSLPDLLEECQIIQDYNASNPSGIICPSIEEMDEPIEPQCPEEPTPVEMPTKTWDTDLTEPICPEEINQPESPGTLEEYAGTKPIAPILSDNEIALALDVRNGVLMQRNVDALTVQLETALTKTIEQSRCKQHTFGNWTLAKQQSCTEEGLIVRVCSVCNCVETLPLAKLAHTYVDTVVEPTRTERGYTIHQCSVCGDSYIDNYVEHLVYLAGSVSSIGMGSVSVSIRNGEGNIYSATEEKNGLYSIYLPAGDYTVILEKEYHRTRYIDIKADSDSVIDLSLFHVCDVDRNNSVNISDVTALLNQLSVSSSASEEIFDVDNNHQVNISDVTALLNYLSVAH